MVWEGQILAEILKILFQVAVECFSSAAVVYSLFRHFTKGKTFLEKRSLPPRIVIQIMRRGPFVICNAFLRSR